ncbi:hypothetical protein DL771_007512 [Monosporascus sp. 5C6A]|nr:hypothetical protein DL771_007512 [Monosporascus sp. 5C6A]
MGAVVQASELSVSRYQAAHNLDALIMKKFPLNRWISVKRHNLVYHISNGVDICSQAKLPSTQIGIRRKDQTLLPSDPWCKGSKGGEVAAEVQVTRAVPDNKDSEDEYNPCVEDELDTEENQLMMKQPGQSCMAPERGHLNPALEALVLPRNNRQWLAARGNFP